MNSIISKKAKAKHNMIYRIRKASQGRVDTRARMIYCYADDVEKVKTHKHRRLQAEYGFMIQTEFVK